MKYTPELDKLAKLLVMSADVARHIADKRPGDGRGEIYDLADQIEEVAEVLKDIVRNETAGGTQEAIRK